MKKYTTIVLAYFLTGLGCYGANSLIFSYGSEYGKGIGTGIVGEEIGGAIEIPKDIAKKYSGNYIGGVRIGFGESSNHEVTVFVTDDLKKEATYSQSSTMNVENGWNEVTFTTPYAIDGAPFFVGYQTEIKTATDTPLGITNYPVSESLGDYIGENGVWSHYGKFYGNVCIELVLTGDKLPQYEAQITELQSPEFVLQNSPFSLNVRVENDGAETISSLMFDISAQGSNLALPTIVLKEGIPSGASAMVEIPDIICSQIATDMKLEVSITEINGNRNGILEDSLATAVFSCSETGYDRKVVVEEFTGTWCGWCPLGTVGLNYMQENYGDKGFIGVSIHSGDPLADDSFAPVLNTFCDNLYPGCVVNRTYTMEPYAENLEEYFLLESKDPTFAEVTLEAAYSESDKLIKLSSSTEFSLEIPDGNYSLAFVLTENNLGPYMQTNYFSGGEAGEMGGWEKEPTKVETYYNEVGRVIENAFGIEGSLPSAIMKGKSYPFNYEISAEYADDIKECEVIALILDGNTKRIVNATKTEIGKGSGIEELAPDNVKGELKIFTLQGLPLKVANIDQLPSGIYIINGKKKVVR